jgi:hypothetical protein
VCKEGFAKSVWDDLWILSFEIKFLNETKPVVCKTN